MKAGREIISLVADRQDLEQFRRKNWEGTFEEYLDLVKGDPRVTRNAFKRVYDMILSYGTETYEENRERKTRYRFFSDPDDQGRDAVFGLDAPLNLLVNAFKSAARGYGIEKRVLLLHGPVGSSKSTIARLLKKGLERYSAREDGALYSLGWIIEGVNHWCPMNEEPLHLVPERFRSDVAAQLNAGHEGGRRAGEDQRRIVPLLPLRLHRPAQEIQRRLDPRGRRRAGPPGDSQRKGSHRHRHLPAER